MDKNKLLLSVVAPTISLSLISYDRNKEDSSKKSTLKDVKLYKQMRFSLFFCNISKYPKINLY